MKLAVAWLLAMIVTLMFFHAATAADKITICHATGSGDYQTLTLPPKAVYGKNGASGHFNEQGTPNAGHENDYLGPCRTPTTPPPTTQPPATTTTAPTTTSTTSTTSPTTVTTAATTTLPTSSTSTLPAPSTTVPDSTSTSSPVTTPDRSTTTSIVVDTCEQFGSCESTTTTTDPDCVGICGPADCDDCDPADRVTTTTDGSTTTTVVTSSTHPPTGAGSTIAMSGFASILLGLGAFALRLARRPI